jgi:hypothetical protein
MGALNLATLAEDFVAIGGRLMVDPAGRFMSAIDMARLFERTWPNPQKPEPFAERRAVAAAYTRAEQRRSHKRELAAMVRQNGSFTAYGWLVWGRC